MQAITDPLISGDTAAILIVDDRPENILPLRKILETNGFVTDSAGSGEEALKKILKNEYSLIILDVQMPGMDGFEVAEHISGFSRSRNTPILFLSAVNTDRKFITAGYMSGGVDYLTKPVDTEIMLLKVKTFVRLYQQQMALKRVQKILESEIDVRRSAEKKLMELNFTLEERVKERTLDLEQKNIQLENANHELQQFAWVVAHDLKEPLRKIQTFMNVIRDKYQNSPEALDYLERTIAASGRMSQLIEDLLSYSRLSGITYFEKTNLNDLLKDLLSELNHVISGDEADITIDQMPEIELIPGQFRQVFQNLFSNSVKFKKRDRRLHIDIHAELVRDLQFDSPAADDGEFCRICFRDNGIGFNQQFAEKVFVIFQRLHPKEEYEGTGIGLAIVKKIITRHNGAITVRSGENEGTEFIIVLPVKQPQNIYQQQHA